MSTHYTLVSDPPWFETGGGRVTRGAQRHYKLLRNNQEIYDAMTGAEVWPDFEDGDTATCWMFATANYVDDALRLMGMLGFQYVTNAVWVKANTDSIVEFQGGKQLDVVLPQHGGLGQRVRMGHEHLLFGRLGKVPSPPPSHRMSSVIYAPRTKHSAKPQEAFDLINTHDAGCVNAIEERNHAVIRWERIEMFARAPRKDWLVWGNEV